MFKKKIAFQLTAGFVLIVLISMLTVGALFIQLFRQYAFESREQLMLERAHNIADIMGESGYSGTGFRGMGGFMRFLNAMTDADVWILDAQGNPWVVNTMGMGAGMGHSISSGPLPAEAQAMISQVLSGVDAVSESFSSVYDEATLTVGVPILTGDQQVMGTVLLHAPVTGAAETMDKAGGILLISMGAALVVATGLGIAYSMSVTRPLKRMNQVALAMAAGDYETRTQLSRPDELGQLGNTLDQLASELGATMDLLYQEKGKLGDIIASISEGIISFDSALAPVNVNGKLAEIMNHGGDYAMASVTADFRALGLIEAMEQVMAEKTPTGIVRSFKGKQLKFTLSPIIDNKGAVTGAVALVQDVSESERLEQLRRDFIANVSHEFRTPLTVIKGSLEALADGTVADPQGVARYLSRLMSETRGLERLVADLLELSRLQSESISIHREPVDIPGLLRDAVNGLRTIAEKNDMVINLTIIDDIPPILGDYDRLRQLFVIFLDNALRYSPAGTQITVTAALKDRVMVSIQDRGFGISPEELPYIWDRFYQGDKSRETSGTGLGLTIAKRLIEVHQGSVTVRSVPGEGTVFEIGLPL